MRSVWVLFRNELRLERRTPQLVLSMALFAAIGLTLLHAATQLAHTVEPFATQIRATKVGKRFALPYDQAAGNLTNLIVTRSDVIKARPGDVRETVAAVVKLVDKLKSDQTGWIESINKYTGLEKAIAAEALKNAFPDYRMHYKSTLAIAVMMKDLKYVSRDVSAEIEKNMNYSFLSEVTKKPKDQLGY